MLSLRTITGMDVLKGFSSPPKYSGRRSPQSLRQQALLQCEQAYSTPFDSFMDGKKSETSNKLRVALKRRSGLSQCFRNNGTIALFPFSSPFKKRVQGPVMFCWEREEPCLWRRGMQKIRLGRADRKPTLLDRRSDANRAGTNAAILEFLSDGILNVLSSSVFMMFIIDKWANLVKTFLYKNYIIVINL